MSSTSHLCSGHDELGSLVLAGMMQPHFKHCWVKEMKNSQSLQIAIRRAAISSVTLPMFLLNKSQGLDGLVIGSVLLRYVLVNYCPVLKTNPGVLFILSYFIPVLRVRQISPVTSN